MMFGLPAIFAVARVEPLDIHTIDELHTLEDTTFGVVISRW